MRVKDIETIQAMHDAALDLTPMLRRLIAYEGGDEDDVSPLSYKGITRLELGLVLRNAGIVTEHALNLAEPDLLPSAHSSVCILEDVHAGVGVEFGLAVGGDHLAVVGADDVLAGTTSQSGCAEQCDKQVFHG